MATKFGIDFIETSAFTGENIVAAFEKIGEVILQDLDGKDKSQVPLTIPKKSTLIRIEMLQVIPSNFHRARFLGFILLVLLWFFEQNNEINLSFSKAKAYDLG